MNDDTVDTELAVEHCVRHAVNLTVFVKESTYGELCGLFKAL